MDSVVVKVNQKSKKVNTPKYMGQSMLDFDCIIKATDASYNPLNEFKPCYQTKQVLKFKLVEPFVQDVIIDPTGPNEVRQAQ